MLKLNYKITKNENSITLLLLPVLFYSSTFLFLKKYGEGDKAYNFATGTIKADYKSRHRADDTRHRKKSQ